MLKVVKRPKEYIAIKVPEDCEDVGKFVSNEFKRNSIPLEVTVHYKLNTGKVLTKGEKVITAGDVIVVDYDMLNGYSVRVMSRKDFDIEFKPADATLEASPTLTAYDLSDDKLPEIEGVALPARPGFSEPFMAYLRALTDYQQKDGPAKASGSMPVNLALDSSRIKGVTLPDHANTPHVRIDIDNIHEAPRIYVDGELLHGITAVVFHFMTRDDVDLGQQSIEIEHYVKDSSLIGMHRETIGERRV